MQGPAKEPFSVLSGRLGSTNVAEYRLLELEQCRRSVEEAQQQVQRSESRRRLHTSMLDWARESVALHEALLHEARATFNAVAAEMDAFDSDVATDKAHLERMEALHAASLKKSHQHESQRSNARWDVESTLSQLVEERTGVDGESPVADNAPVADVPLPSSRHFGPVSLRHGQPLFGRDKIQPLRLFPEREPLPCRTVYGVGDKFLEYASSSSKWTLVDRPEDASVIWMRDRLPEFETTKWDPIRQQLNRFNAQIEWALGDKAALARTTETLYAKDPSLPRFTPRSFTFAGPQDFMTFLAATKDPQLKADFRGQPWILKRSDLASGFGLQVIGDVAVWFNTEKLQLLEMVRAGKHFVLQKYVSNPMTMSGRKFDTRMYVLVLRAYDPLVALMADGYVRLCVSEYRKSNFEDTRIHISNVAQGRTSTEFDTLGYNFFVRPLTKETRDAVGNVLPTPSRLPQWPQIRQRQEEAVRQLLRAVLVTQHATVFAPSDVVKGQLFGFDFTIDANSWPWLTEVQVCPALGIEWDASEVFMDTVELLYEKLKRRMLGGESEYLGWEKACAGTRFSPLAL